MPGTGKGILLLNYRHKVEWSHRDGAKERSSLGRNIIVDLKLEALRYPGDDSESQSSKRPLTFSKV